MGIGHVGTTSVATTSHTSIEMFDVAIGATSASFLFGLYKTIAREAVRRSATTCVSKTLCPNVVGNNFDSSFAAAEIGNPHSEHGVMSKLKTH